MQYQSCNYIYIKWKHWAAPPSIKFQTLWYHDLETENYCSDMSEGREKRLKKVKKGDHLSYIFAGTVE